MLQQLLQFNQASKQAKNTHILCSFVNVNVIFRAAIFTYVTNKRNLLQQTLPIVLQRDLKDKMLPPPPPAPDEPPHPDFWEQKWPQPRFGLKQPDDLLVYFMDFHQIQPTEFKKRKSRYQYVHGDGFFRCKQQNCVGEKGKKSMELKYS